MYAALKQAGISTKSETMPNTAGHMDAKEGQPNNRR
jgi:hypothetical protein